MPVFVHMGTEDQALKFFAQFGSVDIRHVSDPQKQLYKAFGIRRARTLQVLGPKVLGQAFKAYSEGFRQGAAVGDPLQLSGAFLVFNGQVKLAHHAEFAGDEPAFEAMTARAGNLCVLDLD